MIRVAFVCLGNICRSPLAEAAFRAAVREANRDDAFLIESAGTGDWHIGKGADTRSVRVAKAHGLDLTSHRARQFTAKDFDRFDHVIAMDRANVENLHAMARTPEARAKVALFLHDEGGEVPDPYYGTEQDFEHVMRLCKDASAALLARMEEK